MRVLAVTSWGGACGIANYAEMLRDALPPDIELDPCPEALDPLWATVPDSSGLYTHVPDVVWLNYHRGLHSRWTAEAVRHVQAMGRRRKVVITMHDTYGESAPDPLCQSLHDLADAFVVHEPCEGLPKQILIRQGVPAAQPARFYGGGSVEYGALAHKQYGTQPVLGTVGFNFPWKNFDRLAEVTADAGWAYLVCSNNATDEDEARWKAANPYTLVIRGFQPTTTLVSYLSGCDATCFAYECANSGTSGAIRLGLAARKPVIAFRGCRQFRDLAETGFITWSEGLKYLALELAQLPIQRVDPGIAYLAHRDSWTRHGQRYAEIFGGLA